MLGAWGSVDNPVNEMLQAGWKSLKALGNKHLEPKIGTLRLCQQDMLHSWRLAPDHHIVFTFQANPQDCQTRKKMRFLKDNDRAGDKYFNEWPVPMYQFSHTSAEHNAIFADDVAVDEGG